MQENKDKKNDDAADEVITATPAQQYINNTVAMNENSEEEAKEQIEEQVKESFKEQNVPVEPVLGNDGIEVGGQG